MLKVAIFNFKGGTAKSTTALNLGTCLTTAKRRVLLLDLDLFDLKAEGDLFTPALARLAGFDVCLMDCSPGLGVDSELVNQLFALPKTLLMSDSLDKLNSTTKLQNQGPERVIGDLQEAIASHGIRHLSPLSGIETLSWGLIHKLSVQAMLKCDRLLIPVIGEPAVLKGLSEAVQLIREIAHSEPVTVYASRSSGAKAYKALAKECWEAWGVSS